MKIAMFIKSKVSKDKSKVYLLIKLSLSKYGY